MFVIGVAEEREKGRGDMVIGLPHPAYFIYLSGVGVCVFAFFSLAEGEERRQG